MVFDGYETHSTKDEEHFHRGGTQSSSDIAIESQIQVPVSQQEFMGNAKNKAGLIKLPLHILKLLVVTFTKHWQMLTD